MAGIPVPQRSFAPTDIDRAAFEARVAAWEADPKARASESRIFARRRIMAEMKRKAVLSDVRLYGTLEDKVNFLLDRLNETLA